MSDPHEDTAPPVDGASEPPATVATADVAAPSDAKRTEEQSSGRSRGALEAVIVWIVIGAAIVLINDTSRAFVFHWWWAFAIVAAVLLVVLALPVGRRWVKDSQPTTRAAVFIFVVLPALLGFVGSVAVLPHQYQLTALRVVFLVVVCLLPATMWYLFLVTRKASLLNEFLANIDRLGLLRAAEGESDASRSRRVQSYLQKFEATYGDLPSGIHEDVLKSAYRYYSRADTSAAGTLSTTTVPVMLSTVLIAIGWLITLPPGELGAAATGTADAGAAALADTAIRAFKPNSAPVALAFLGAYFFSLQMLFRRYVLKDLGGSAYVAVAIRIILAVIGIWVLMAVGGGGLFGDTQLMIVAFVFGVFPRVIWQVVESIFKRIAGIAVRSMVSQLPVSDLDGLTVWHESRLEEEDIENIPSMASADLVELLLNTRFPPERIIDWIDQAILYTQLGPQREEATDARRKLRTYGIRTATSLQQASQAARDTNTSEVFDKILTDAGGVSVMKTLEAALSTTSNLKLIRQWRNMPGQRPRAADRQHPSADGATRRPAAEDAPDETRRIAASGRRQ